MKYKIFFFYYIGKIFLWVFLILLWFLGGFLDGLLLIELGFV
ncbi:hypothetical protein N481_06915 [Pseudoalteromonas luteoviolacea S4047-1]|uniref:Uncharacterized protein n=1 Tax=Pseudoalteromonas luteoviolacea S4054 TaxID=1129367 RepID=A0A0F6AEV3_9GAMM|nr:hypothetical protein N479_10500 [Pseudoalteromonas luteoviolacea S4054]KZN76074.1 hypothetical protein N481_06915 [Pseudoalteromonas luteoviolacea S4047-1]